MRLKHYLDQGVSKAELSRRFGVSERTIYYWIAIGSGLVDQLATKAGLQSAVRLLRTELGFDPVGSMDDGIHPGVRRHDCLAGILVAAVNPRDFQPTGPTDRLPYPTRRYGS